MSAPEAERATRRIFQPIKGRGLRKLLWKRMHLPRGIVHPALSAAKAAANPGQVRLRRELASRLGADSRAACVVPESDGYRAVAVGELPGSDAVVARCTEIYRALRADAEVDDHLFNPRKRFLLALLSGADFCRYPELISFMVSRPILDTVTTYLGSVPILAGAALWWTPENESAERSQLFHFDGEDERQMKLLVNIFETGDEHGPFTLIPADRSAPLCGPRAMRRRITDEEVDSVCGLDNAVRFVGGAGSAGFVDTSRCLHFGSRHTRRDRLVLMVQFTRFDCPTESTFDFAVPPDLPGLDPDRLQKLALGIE
jgi:hypothetical protein